MTRGRALLLAAAIAVLALAVWQPRTRASAPDWVVRRSEWNEARRAARAARWSGTLGAIRVTYAREAAAESAYVGSLEAWAASARLESEPPPGPTLTATLREGVLDLVERGRGDAAYRILRGPLRADRLTLPLRARFVGLRVSPDSGLALLGWPPDRRDVGPAAISWDAVGRAEGEAVLAARLVAAELADSADLPRAQRAALWTLLDHPRGAVRSYARIRLARALARGGEPRLAGALLQGARGVGDEEQLLLGTLKADLAAQSGDSLEAVRQLIWTALEPSSSTRVRHALGTRAAERLRGSRVDSLSEGMWLDLVRALGNVGEAETGLSLLRSRRRPPSTAADALAREEVEAGLLARLRRHPEAVTAYTRLLARPGTSRAAHAGYALGLARSLRSMGEFTRMDSAFVLATTIDSTSSAAGQAAWERAREWEDRKTPREAAEILRWASRYVRDPTVVKARMAHAVIAWLRAGQPDSAQRVIPGTGLDDLRGYWSAQVSFAMGDTAAGVAQLREVPLGDPWTYEGVRAREELRRRGVEPPDPAPVIDPAIPSRGDRSPARAPLELPVGMRLPGSVGATELLMDALRQCAREDSLPRARACTEGLEQRGVFRVGRSDAVPADRLEYPPAYPTPVLAAAEQESLSAALLWAIMRQESAYQRFARSRAAAIGLLQLLPTTASRLQGSSVSEGALTDPGLNVRLGARYLRGLIREFGDPRAAMAAYNAGEDAVRRWLGDRPVVDDIWVELIPYRETRDYVKQVYSIWRRYEARYGAAPASVGGASPGAGRDRPGERSPGGAR